MIIPALQYGFRFLVRINFIGGELKLSRFSPVLNQLAIEDSSSVDTIISGFYENLHWEALSRFDKVYLSATARLILWKKQAPSSFFGLKIFSLDSLIKFNLDRKQPYYNTNSFRRSKLIENIRSIQLRRRRKALEFSHLSAMKWGPEYGFRLSVEGMLKSFSTLDGTGLSYLKRSEMLGRKINFRQKLKKKTADY